jgi:hypothetical protein
MFDGDQLLGPVTVPTLFADNAEVKLFHNNFRKTLKINPLKIKANSILLKPIYTQVTKKTLIENPAKAHQDVLRIHSRMFIPENIPPGRTAFAIITKPREAEIIQPYKKGVNHQSSKSGPSGHKKPRTEEPSESGKILKTVYEKSIPDTKYLSKRNDLEKVLKHLPDYVNEQYVTAAFAKSRVREIG